MTRTTGTTGTIRRGLMAGAAGTAALHAATYLDMAWRGRPASDVPERTITALADRWDLQIAADPATRQSRVTALGALGGLATGLAVGIAAGAVRSAGVRLPYVPGALATTGAALVAGNASAVRLGTTDPRAWSGTDWVSDVVPHLAFGFTTSAVLRATEDHQRDRSTPVRVSQPPRTRRPRGTLRRSAAVGLASGARSSFGVAAALLATDDPGAGRRILAAVPVAGELAADKLARTPSRLEPPSLAGRVLAGSGAAATLARQAGTGVVLPAAVGGATALVGSVAGAAWRGTATAQQAPLQAALLEDATGLLLTTLALRGRP